MITIENIGNKIVLFGRDKNNKAYIHIDEGFKPYFYYEDWKGDVNTIDGGKAIKLICDNPSEVPVLRAVHNKTYEADIRYTNRYIIDKIEDYKKENIRLCYIDIEIARTEKGYESAEEANNPILCIGCYDNFNKEYKQFFIDEISLKKEKEMLQDFLKYIQDTDPDILLAWNGDAFDFPFLINRIKKLKLDEKKLARLNGDVFVTDRGAKVFGRILFDLMYGYKKFIGSEGRESWSLDYITKYELKEKGGKEKYKGELDDLFKKDLDKFLSYNKRDVELMVLLDEQMKIIDFFDEIRRLCFCRFEDVFMNSKIADCLCLKYSKDKFVLPNCPRENIDKPITGGYVKDNTPQLYENVCCMDMKSLYPSIMIGFNISYETLLKEKSDNCINIDDKYYFKKQIGIIPSIVKPMLEIRKNVAKEMSKVKTEKGMKNIEYQSLWMRQYSLKVIANSFYGVLLYPTFRLYNRDAGQSITYTAQKIIKEVHNWFENNKIKVIYGDTDSCFLLMERRSKEDMITLNTQINEYFKNYFRQYGVGDENNIFKLEFEKIFSTLFFKRKADGKGAKKKYAGRLIWQDGKDVNEISITGFESRRSDNPSAGRKLLKDVLTMILDKKPKEDIDKYLFDFKNDIRNGKFEVEEIGFPVGIQKNLEEYGNQMQIRASRTANEKHHAQIKKGDKIKYIFVKQPCGVIAFKNYMWDGYDIDYDKVIRRIVDLKIGPLYDSLGWRYDYLIINKPKKSKEKSFEEQLKQVGLWN